MYLETQCQTCNGLDLETPGFRPVMPKKLPKCLLLSSGHVRENTKLNIVFRVIYLGLKSFGHCIFTMIQLLSLTN